MLVVVTMSVGKMHIDGNTQKYLDVRFLQYLEYLLETYSYEKN